MKSKNLALVAGFAALGLFWACAKNATPALPIHDTVTVHKTDTLTKTDTFLKPVDTPNLKNGLVLYLPFNGSFADSSGSGNTVTAIAGATLDYDMHGYASSAFNSTGNGARLVVSNNGAYKVDTAFSVSFDFMIRNSLTQMVFLSIVNPSTGNGPTFDCGLMIPALPNNFGFSGNSSLSTCSETGSAHYSSSVEDTTSFVPQPGSWYNVICIFTKGKGSVYVNGQLVKTVTSISTSVLFCPDAKFIVGGWWDSYPQNINGKLDEVRMYNRTLNAKEISWLSRNFQPTSTKLRTTPVTR